MSLRHANWLLALAGFLAAEILLIAAAIAWVAIYSHFINPGRPVTEYQQYADQNVPYVALLLSLPVFFVTCRILARRAPAIAQPTALAVFVIFLLTEVASWFGAPNPSITPLFEAINIPLKLLACLAGARAVAHPPTP